MRKLSFMLSALVLGLLLIACLQKEKGPHQLVSIHKFAIYSGLELEVVKAYITD